MRPQAAGATRTRAPSSTAEGGEDVDVEFANVGGSIGFNVADSFLDFDTDIKLGTASKDRDGHERRRHHPFDGTPSSTVNGDDIDGLASADQITTGDGGDIIDARATAVTRWCQRRQQLRQRRRLRRRQH